MGAEQYDRRIRISIQNGLHVLALPCDDSRKNKAIETATKHNLIQVRYIIVFEVRYPLSLGMDT